MRQICRHRMDLVDCIANQKRKISASWTGYSPNTSICFRTCLARPPQNCSPRHPPKEILKPGQLRPSKGGRNPKRHQALLRHYPDDQRLFHAAASAFRDDCYDGALHDPVLHAFYQKKQGEGKRHYTAIGTVARKRTLIIYAVLRDNQPYMPHC